MPDVHGEMEAVAATLGSEESPSSTTDAPGTSSTSDTPALATSEPGSSAPIPPVAQEDDESTLPAMGAIPVDRVKKIIANARLKASTEVEGRYAWAKDLTPEQAAEQRQILGWLDSDPVGFMRFIESQVKADPQHAHHFATPTPQPTATPDPEPQPDIQLQDGTLTYSQEQFNKLFGWRERQMENRYNERLGPIEKVFKQHADQMAGITKAQEVLGDAKTWPGFSENMNDIRVLMEGDRRITLESAYRRVVIPKLQAQDKDRRDALRKEILVELKNKPAANTEVPGRTSNSPPESFKGKSTEDVMRSVLAEMGG